MGDEWMRQLGFLFAHALNSMEARDDPDGMGSCCRVNCGPCSALDWYWQNADLFASKCAVLAYPAGDWSWQYPDGTINWVWVEEQWAPHQGCSYGPEEGWRCDFDEGD